MAKLLTKHVSISEVCHSETAKRLGIDNCPKTNDIWDNARLTALTIFEPTREYLGVPIKINSFYRSPLLNKYLGGSKTSAHLKALAMDLDDVYSLNYGINNKQIFDYIKKNLNFDQLIWELGTNKSPSWVHVGIKRNFGRNRRQILRSYKTKYGIRYVRIG